MIKRNIYKSKVFWFVFISLFSSGYIFFKSPFEFYFYYLMVFTLTPYLVFKIGVPKFYFKIFFIPLFVGIVHLLLDNNQTFTFLKIFGGLSVTLLFYYYLIHYFKFNILYLFEIYCSCCWILVLIAIVQIISFLINFEPGYNFAWILNKWGFVKGGIIGFRVNSILSEPTYLASCISPAVYISVRNLLFKEAFIFSKTKSLLVISISILTTSTIGFLGILISLILCTNTIRLRYIVIGAIISLSGFIITYNNIPDFKNRIDAAKGLLIDQEFNLENTNNSSFVLYNNLHIAIENMKRNPFFGTGLGSHETAFKKYTLTNTVIQYNFDFNIKDGNSLFVRLCTETGLLGLFFVLIICFRGFIYKIDENRSELNIHKIISQSLFTIIILTLIRQGNYMLNGLPFIFLLYYFNWTKYKEKIISIEKT